MLHKTSIHSFDHFNDLYVTGGFRSDRSHKVLLNKIKARIIRRIVRRIGSLNLQIHYKEDAT